MASHGDPGARRRDDPDGVKEECASVILLTSTTLSQVNVVGSEVNDADLPTVFPLWATPNVKSATTGRNNSTKISHDQMKAKAQQQQHPRDCPQGAVPKAVVGQGSGFKNQNHGIPGTHGSWGSGDQVLNSEILSSLRFPYSVYFRVRRNSMVVLAVFHGRRNPAVWQRRAR